MMNHMWSKLAVPLIVIRKPSCSDHHIAIFQKRYENGYDLLLDKDHIRWLTLNHPDALPQRANLISYSESMESGCGDKDIQCDSADNAGGKKPTMSNSAPIKRALPPPPAVGITPIR